MEKDNFKTDVMFRVESDGAILAVFPHDVETNAGHVAAYTNKGQHTTVDYNYCIKNCKPAKPEQYADLKRELEGIWYSLNIVQRRSNNKYFRSYRNY